MRLRLCSAHSLKTPRFSQAAGAPYNYSNLVVIRFFPSVFVHPQQLWHFLAYACGAAQVFVDTVTTCQHPRANRNEDARDEGQCTAAMRLAGHGAACEATGLRPRPPATRRARTI